MCALFQIIFPTETRRLIGELNCATFTPIGNWKKFARQSPKIKLIQVGKFLKTSANKCITIGKNAAPPLTKNLFATLQSALSAECAKKFAPSKISRARKVRPSGIIIALNVWAACTFARKKRLTSAKLPKGANATLIGMSSRKIYFNCRNKKSGERDASRFSRRTRRYRNSARLSSRSAR